MNKVILRTALGFMLCLWAFSDQAHADVLPAPTCPPICVPGGGGGGSPPTSQAHGPRIGTQGALNIGAAVAGNVILYVGNARPSDYILWNVGSVLGPVGGGSALALFQEEQGLFTKLFRPGGFKCQAKDVGRVDGCAQWLKDHPALKLKKIKRSRRR